MTQEILLKQAAECLVECEYNGATDIQFAHDVWGVFVPEPDLDNIWIEVDPFEDSLEGRQQLEVLLGHFTISTVVNGNASGWWVDCWKPASQDKDKKDCHVIIHYLVRYEGKYRREAELRCIKQCLSELAGIPCPK